jgi:hypothetical protein
MNLSEEDKNILIKHKYERTNNRIRKNTKQMI